MTEIRDICAEAGAASTPAQRKLAVKLANIPEVSDQLSGVLYQCLQAKKSSRLVKVLSFFSLYLDKEATDAQKEAISAKLIADLLPAGLQAKDRIVRSRVAQLMFAVLNNCIHLINDHEYDLLISSIRSRYMDKEASVRGFVASCLLLLQVLPNLYY